MTKTLDDLERLEALRSAGALGQDEFAALKSKILAGNGSIPVIDSEQPYEVNSERYSSDDQSNRGSILVVMLLTVLVLGGFFYLSAGTETGNNSADDPAAADIGADAPDPVEPESPPQPQIQYDFKINKYVQIVEFITINRYELVNRSTGPVELSSVMINKRDDCVAFTRNKKGKISLSQDSNYGEIEKSANFGVGMAIELQYNRRICGDLIYADVKMVDGSFVELKAL